MDRLAWLVPERTPSSALLATRFDALGIHPSLGPDEQKAVRVLHATHIAQREVASLGAVAKSPVRVAGSGKNACSLVVSGGKTTVVGASHCPIHRRMQFYRGGLDGFDTSGAYLA